MSTAKISSGVGDLAVARRDNALLREQAAVLELIAKGAPLDEVLAELIRYVEAQEGGVRCGLLIVDEDGRHFRQGSGPSLPEPYHRALAGVPITPPYLGPCGKAAHRNCTVAVPDVANDDRWSRQWRDLALSSGFAAVRSTPIPGSDGTVLASLALYYDHPGEPSPADPELIDIAAHLAAIAIERNRSEAGARHAEEQTRELLDALHQQSGMLIQSQQKLAVELAMAERLQRISTTLASGSDVQALYEGILDAAVELMHSDFASMQRLYPERGEAGELRLLGFRGFDPAAARFWEWVRADSGSTCGEAMRTGRRSVATDVETCDFMADSEDRTVYLQTGIHAVQSTPLFSRSGRMLGMISTHWRAPYQPTENELQRLDVLARQAADLIERTEAEAALRDSEARYRALVSASNQVLYRHNPDWSEMRQLSGGGFLADTETPDPNWFDRYIHPDDQPPVWAAIQEAIRTKSVFELEHRVVRADGTLGWTLSRSIPLLDDNGEVVEWFGAASDVTERKRHERHQKLLVNELNHRVKNTLATVQSIALQTLRNSPSTGEAREQITARLIALSKAHDVLTQTSWEGAQLRQIVTEATAAHDSENGSRFDIEGPDVWVSAKSALALAMALHELCTNAVKYGALSNEQGRVAIEWMIGEGDGAAPELRMRWTEAGGPPVTQPKRRGFGSRLIERGLGQDLGGAARVEFAPTGVICTIRAPLGSTSDSFTAPDERPKHA